MICLKRYCKQQDLAQWPSLQSLLLLLDPDRERCHPPPPPALPAFGVGHPESNSTVFCPVSVLPASL